MKKLRKYDKVLLVLAFILFLMLITWFVSAGSFSTSTGEFSDSGLYRAGINDFFYMIYAAIYFVAVEMVYIFAIGGVYGVLLKTKFYNNIVNSVVDFVRGKELLVLAVLIVLGGIYSSIAGDVLILLCLAPFIMTVFLKAGKDRLTAINAAFGGIFVGLCCQTFGSYGSTYYASYSSLAYTEGIWIKIAIFVVACVLYVLFAVLNAKKYKRALDSSKYDMFNTEVEVNKCSRRKVARVFQWIILIATILILLVGEIDWEDSFNITLFSDLHTNISTWEIGGVTVLANLLGQTMTAIGSWSLTVVTGILVFAILIIGLLDKLPFHEICQGFGDGVKKVTKLALLYALCYICTNFCMYFPSIYTIFNKMFGSGSFNIFMLLLIGFLSKVFLIDSNFIAYSIGEYLQVTFTDNIVNTVIIWKAGIGLATLLAPTSVILLLALSYLDVSYKKWLKYIWKFALSFVIAFCIIMLMVCYM